MSISSLGNFSPFKNKKTSAPVSNAQICSNITFSSKANLRNVEFPSNKTLTKPNNEKPLKTFLEFAKTQKVQMVIKKLRERSKFRKPERLHTVHYDLINDRGFFKITTESKLDNQRSAFKKFPKIQVMQNAISTKLDKLKITISNVPIFHPNHKIKLIWDIMIVLLSFLELIIISLEITFNIDLETEYSSTSIFKVTAILCFMINILVNFNTTYYEYGVAVLSRQKIASNYLKGLYPTDFLSVLSLIANVLNSKKYVYLSIASLGFVLSYKNLKKIIKNLEETYEISGEIFDLLSLFFKTISIAHCLACCWHAIGFFTKESEKSWLSINNFADFSWKERYLLSLYWAFTTICTVGYGDITPQNTIEMAFACFVMLCGTFGLGYCVNSVGVLLSRLEERSKEMVETMKIADIFMRRKNINLNLRVKVKKYLEFLLKSQKKNLEKESEFLEKLPISLRNEILLESNMKFLQNFPILSQNFSAEFLEFLAINIKPFQYSPSDIIYSQGTFTDQSLFLIFDGVIELCLEKGTNHQLILKKLRKGEHFGEHPFFFESAHQETARSLGFSTLYKVTHKELLGYLSNFPQDKERFCELKDKNILNKELNETFRGCLSCSKRTHLIDECPLLIYSPDKQFLIERLNFSKPQKRATFLRECQKRNTLMVKAEAARSVMKVRFDKSLMNIYYGTFICNQGQTQGDLQVLEKGTVSGISENMKVSLPLRSHSLDLNEWASNTIKLTVPFLSLRSLSKNEDEHDSSPQSQHKQKTTRKSFCPNKEEINLMFKKEEEDEESIEEKGILKKLRQKEDSQKRESHKNFNSNTQQVKFENQHSEFRQKVLISTLASKDELKNRWEQTEELQSPELREFSSKGTMVNQTQISKEVIKKDDSLCKLCNSRTMIESPLEMKSNNRLDLKKNVETDSAKLREKVINVWKKTKNNLTGYKSLKVQTIGNRTRINKFTNTQKTIKMKNALEEENISNGMGNSQNNSKNRFRSLSSRKTTMFAAKEEPDLRVSFDQKRNLFWQDFENMHEFEFYFTKHNASNVIYKIDWDNSQKNLPGKKSGNKSMCSAGSPRKGVLIRNM